MTHSANSSPGYVKSLIRGRSESSWRASLATVAQEELERARQSTEVDPADSLPLVDWIPHTSPELIAPTHLSAVTEAFDAIEHGEVMRLALSVPPRHFKSTTILHGIVMLMKRIPGLKVAYFTYGAGFSAQQSRDAMRIVKHAGMRFGDRCTFQDWNLENGSSFYANGLIAGATGQGFDLIVVDDPYRKRADAESHANRTRKRESFDADIMTRQGNKPTSFIVLHTRWHTDDLIATVTHKDFRNGTPFDMVNIPAISAEGEALCPEFWPLERLAPFQANEYEWWSQFMGAPRPRGAELFKSPATCLLADVPRNGQHSKGIDLAYTAKTHADYSVSLVLTKWDGKYYVADVVRKQVQAPEFVPVLKAHQDRYAGPMWWYASGTEKGSAQFIIASGIHLTVKNASTDKFQRAQAVSAAWNAGDIIVPTDAPWSEFFRTEVCGFTGVGDINDDMVDALAAAYDAQPIVTDTPTYQSIKRRSTAGWGAHY